MNKLFIHDDAKADLNTLRQHDRWTTARILSFLEQIANDQDLMDRLTQDGYGADRTTDFDVSKWFTYWNAGQNLWRIKIWDLENKGIKYRIIYAFEPREHHHHILAIAPREFNYEPNHPITQRVLNAYREL